MLQKLPISLTLVKPCNTAENLINEIRQIIDSLYRIRLRYNKKLILYFFLQNYFPVI